MTAVGGLRIQGFAERVSEASHGMLKALVVTVGDNFVWSDESGVEVLRCPDPRVRNPRPANTRRIAAIEDRDSRPSVRSAVKTLARRVANEVLFPDEQMFWLLQLKTIQRLVNDKTGGSVDVVVASSPPPTALFIGRHLAQVLDAAFIADFRDSWLHNPHWTRSRLRLSLDHWAQRQLLRGVDAVVSPAPVVLAEFLDVPSSLLSTGYSEVDARNADGRVDPDRFRLLHAGQLYGGRRDSRVVVATAALLCERNALSPGRVCATFIGDDSADAARIAKSMGQSDYVEALSTVDLHTARGLMQAAGALVSLSWESSQEDGAIPGKLYEYLAAGRPVIAFGGSAGTVGPLLKEAEVGIHATGVEEAADYLQPFVDAWMRGSVMRACPSPTAVSKLDATTQLIALGEALRHSSEPQ